MGLDLKDKLGTLFTVFYLRPQCIYIKTTLTTVTIIGNLKHHRKKK